MNQWQQSFARRVEHLREASIKKFEDFAGSVLTEVYRDYSEFTSRHEFHCSSPQQPRGARFFKFALSEDAYVLLYFRSRGIDSVECEHECSAPGQGCAGGERVSVPLAEASRAWVENCFQTSLDALLARVCGERPAQRASELVGAAAG